MRRQVEVAVLVGGDLAHPGRRRVAVVQLLGVLPGIGCEGRDVDQAADLLVGAGLADDGAAPGMPDQHHVAVLVVQRALGSGHVVGQRGEGVLHHGDLDAFGLQQGNYPGPVGTVGEGAVDDHHRRLRAGRLAAEGEERSGHGEGQGEGLGFVHDWISCVWEALVSGLPQCAGIGRLSEAGRGECGQTSGERHAGD
ncbi:hypothetical protein D3C72_1546160 [compost metagenome]